MKSGNHKPLSAEAKITLLVLLHSSLLMRPCLLSDVLHMASTFSVDHCGPFHRAK